MKILIDMNLSPRWCDVLKRHGYESVHWGSIGDPRAEDAEILQWALQHEYVVLTHDLDFGAILAATNADAPSVLQVRTQAVLPATMELLIVDALQRYEPQLAAGALIVIDESKFRVRILPLRR